VLVLGATGDLGSAVTRRLSAEGTPVIVHGYSRTTELAYLADETGAVARVEGDLTTDDGVDALAETLAGFETLSGLINCSGINPSPDTVAEIDRSEWQHTLDLNLTSVWRTASLALPKLRAARSGAVVLVSSVFGIRTPSRRAAYGVSKHALTGLAQAIAQEEEGIVRANVVAPGRRPLSSMTPTMVLKDGKLLLVTGSPGGPTIINTVLQIVTNVIDFGMPAAQAVEAPRIHHQWMPDEITHERFGLSADTAGALRAMGHTVRELRKDEGYNQGDGATIALDATTGLRLGAADPRRGDARAVGY